MSAFTLAIFLLIFLSVYGGMHLYVYRRVVRIVPGHRKILAATLVLLMSLPVVTEVIAHGGLNIFIKPVGWIAYFWMGLAFLLWSAFLFIDTVRLILLLLMRSGAISCRTISPLSIPVVYFAIGVCFLGSVYGVTRTDNLTLEVIPVYSSKPGIQPVRIAQISDVHFGLLTDKAQAHQIVDRLVQQKPDLIVSTGDLVDMQADHIGTFADMLKQLNPPLGKYAVPGNHEVYAGLQDSKNFIKRASFRLLNNESVKVSETLTLVGVNDPAVARQAGEEPFDESELLKKVDPTTFVVLLKHQPVVDKQSVGLFDLQLSGHTHGGQIFPFILLTKLVYDYGPGLTRAGEQAWIYVSRGTGTWGPPMRIGADPEISLFEIQASHSRAMPVL